MNIESVSQSEQNYDLALMVAKPLYFGLAVNILIPMGLLLICYYVEMHNAPTDRLGFNSTLFLYLFGALALAEASIALILRAKLMGKPMIRSLDTFEQDIKSEMLKRLRPVFLIVASVSTWGIVYYFLSGRFNESLLFIVFSFVVFQFVRPRYGSVEKLVSKQLAMAKRGELLR